MTGDRQQLVESVRAAISDKQSEEEVLRAAVEMIAAYSEGFDWTGFYLLRGGALEVGPYIGPRTPHTRIELNAGICGAAASQKRSIIVPDVAKDPRFLACSATTRSEIVVPMMDGGICLGEIDIDSNQADFFTEEDREMLEQVAAVVVEKLKQVR